MKRSYNIGTECYALLTTQNDSELLIPVQIILLERYVVENNNVYKVKIRDIFETDFDYIKENLSKIRLFSDIKDFNGINDITKPTLIKKSVMKQFNNKVELLTYLNGKPFLLEENFITLDKIGLKDLYMKFVKYIINYHYERLFRLTSRSFLSGTPIYEDQKDMFLKRVKSIGFGDTFEKINLDILK